MHVIGVTLQLQHQHWLGSYIYVFTDKSMNFEQPYASWESDHTVKFTMCLLIVHRLPSKSFDRLISHGPHTGMLEHADLLLN